MWQHAYQFSLKGTIKNIFPSALLIVIASCGGGGGSGGGGTTPTQVNNGNPGPIITTPIITAPINPASLNYTNILNLRAPATMKYPATWSRSTPSDPEVVFEVRSPTSETLSNIRDEVVLYKVDLATLAPGSSPNDDGESLQFEVVSEREIVISGIDALEVIIDAFEEGENLRFVFFEFVLNDNLYTLIYGNTRNEFERKVEVIRHMASTLRVGQNIISGTNTGSRVEYPGKPAIASDGQDFLVVSCRRATTGASERLMGRIVRADRTMGAEFVIHTNTNCLHRYGAIFDGINYMLIYRGGISGGSAVIAKRINRQGIIIDNVPIAITPPNLNDFLPTALFDGSRTLVVWNRFGTNNAVMGAFVSVNGTVTPAFTIANNQQTVYPAPENSLEIQIAYGNNQFMVIWSRNFIFDSHTIRNYPIYGQMLNLAGNLLLPQPIEIRSDPGTMPRYIQVASDGTDYLVAWNEGVMGNTPNAQGNHTIYARKISSAGSILNGNASQTGVLIAPPLLATGPNISPNEEIVKDYLDLSFTNGNYLFLWASPLRNEAGMYAVKASRDMNSISPATPVVGTQINITRAGGAPSFIQYTHPNIAYSNNQSLTVWPSQTGFVEGWFNIQ